MSTRSAKFCVVSPEQMGEPEALWNAHSFDWKDIESIYIWVRDMLQNGYKVVSLTTGGDQYALSAVDDELIYNKLLDLPGVTEVADPMVIPAEHFERMEYRPEEYKNFLESIWKMSNRIAARHIRAKKFWEKLYQAVWGTPSRGPEPIENKHLQVIARRFLASLSPIPKALIRETVSLATKNGFYTGDHKKDALAYLWYVLMENRSSWPSMSKDEYNALVAVMDYVAYSGETLKYRGVMRMPEGKTEHQIDKTIIELALWALNLIRTEVKTNLTNICKDEGKTYVKETEEFKGATGAAYFLQYSFKKNLREKPLMFQRHQPFVLLPFVQVLP